MKHADLKLRDLAEMQPALLELSAVKLPAKVSFRISRLLAQIKPDWDAFNKARQELFDRIGEEITAPGGQKLRTVMPDRQDEFDAEYAPLIEQAISDIEFAPIKVADLGDAEISAASLLALQRFIIE